MSYALLPEAHNSIVHAITNDLSVVNDHSIGEVSFARLEDYDPLGIAFYVYAILRTGYKNLTTDSFPDLARFWIEEKVKSGDILPYVDRDLAAISLTAFSLHKFQASCPSIREEFLALATQYFDGNRGFFNSFFHSAIVSLGVSVLAPTSTLNQPLQAFLKRQILDHSNVVFNDSKNFLACHLWAREGKSEELINKLITECLDRSRREDCTLRDQVYYTYVLLEEVERVPREFRGEVQKLCESSLDYIRMYSVETGYPSEVLAEYAEDVALSSQHKHLQSFSVTPRLSRILLSAGLIIDRLYSLKAHAFFSKKAQWERALRGIGYPAAFLFLTFLVLREGSQRGMPISLKEPLHATFIGSAFAAFLYALLMNFIWVAIILSLGTAAWIFFQQIFLASQSLSEVDAGKELFKFLKKNFWLEIGLAIFIAFVQGVFNP